MKQTATSISSDTVLDGDFFDADYYERGKATGKGWYENYRWMPIRSIREALAFIEFSGIDRASRVLDVGCAKGFLVRALRMLEISTEGCDISDYALSFAPGGCWNCADRNSWEAHVLSYTHVVAKDIFEHCKPDQLIDLLFRIALVSRRMACVVPIGDHGVYRIKEYHLEQSHFIAENEEWWADAFLSAGWYCVGNCSHVPGLKDNWQHRACGTGNHVFLLEHK